MPLCIANQTTGLCWHNNPIGQIIHINPLATFIPSRPGIPKSPSVTFPSHRQSTGSSSMHQPHSPLGSLHHKSIIRNHAILRRRAIGIAAVILPHNHRRATPHKRIKRNQRALRPYIVIIRCPIHHHHPKLMERMEQIIHNNLIRPLHEHTASPAFALAKKEILRHHIVIPMPKPQPPPAIAKRISAEKIAVGFDRDDFSLAITAFKKVVFDQGSTVARLRVPGISLCNKLKRFVAIVQLALWNIDEVVVVDVVFFSLVSHDESHQLAVVEPIALMIAVVSLVLEPAVVNFNLLTFRTIRVSTCQPAHLSLHSG